MSTINWPSPTRDAVHRAMFAYGEPVSLSELAGLLDDRYTVNALYSAMGSMLKNDYAQVAGERRIPGRGGKPILLYALTERGRDNVPDPVPHHEVGRGSGAPSIRPADATDFRNHPGVAQVMGETRRTTEERYPLLEALRSRDTVRHSLREAALMLPPHDPLRRDMLAKVEALAQTAPLEEEYLRYAAKHA